MVTSTALRKFRDQAHLTRAQLAAACQVHESTVWRLERGLRGASDSLIYRLARALGVDAEQVRAAIPPSQPQKRYIKSQDTDRNTTTDRGGEFQTMVPPDSTYLASELASPSILRQAQ